MHYCKQPFQNHSKQNNRVNILKTVSVSPFNFSDDSRFEDLFQIRHFQVVKNSGAKEVSPLKIAVDMTTKAVT